MMNTRMQLLKIPEVLSIKCGKRIDPEVDWPFFIAIDFESMDKYSIFCEDPIYVKFMEEVIKPNTQDSLVLGFRDGSGQRRAVFVRANERVRALRRAGSPLHADSDVRQPRAWSHAPHHCYSTRYA